MLLRRRKRREMWCRMDDFAFFIVSEFQPCLAYIMSWQSEPRFFRITDLYLSHRLQGQLLAHLTLDIHSTPISRLRNNTEECNKSQDNPSKIWLMNNTCH